MKLVSRPDSQRRRLLFAGPALLALVATGACKTAEPASCTNTSGLAPGDVQARAALGYADLGPDSQRHCFSCSQYVEPESAGSCGGCKVLKGPIHPRGTCNAFTPKA